MTIEAPVWLIASPMMTKMPVPMIAPTPSAVRSSAPTERFSVDVSESARSFLCDLRERGP